MVRVMGLRAVHGHVRDDCGYSLAELLVVMALMGVILMLTWNVNRYITTVNQSNEREAYLGTEIRTPLMYIDKLLIQNGEIEGGSTQYRISFFTDVNADDVKERNVIEATSGGTLVATSWNVDGSNNNVGAPIRVMSLSDKNANFALGQPLFTYVAYDDDGNPVVITEVSQIAGNTRSVITTIHATWGDQTLSDTRESFLRNRE